MRTKKMLRVVPKGWFFRTYQILDNDTIVAILESSFWREAAELTIQGSRYSLAYQGFGTGLFLLTSGGSILARAVQPKTFYRSLQVELSGKQYTLEAERVMSNKFVLSDGEVRAGAVYFQSALSTKVVLDLPEEIPLAERVFIFWLVSVQWNRSD